MTIVISDIHGCYDTLRALVDQLPQGHEVICVGDLIDRGPNSRDVIEFVIKAGFKSVMGNHEQMMLDMDRSTGFHMETFELIDSIWGHNGGVDTMDSYGDDEESYNRHIEWIKTLPLVYEKDGVLVSHSSAAEFVNRGHDKRWAFDVLWERNLRPDKIANLFNVFGHTILPQPMIGDHYACIDTGCFTGRMLTAIQFPEKILYQQPCIDKTRFNGAA